ncbi:acyl carrier protein phosphodiesterase [Paraglaciecola chathamensis]|jgi:acyl carrier protein phosphodiesterase|uniref:Acyl carrier protein phosphodiesterase n=1 Tax=Paraglaciecola chathamensis S18K6 TaxID=1127672 RepID=A0AAV3V6V7_9ALTE|nr:ACP phosphodiesterase [Paraglaciecola chathamensis]GAC12437.1 acyl carrier protein phosphodiesterase [Paraglaciecola chathamensis S18K6]
MNYIAHLHLAQHTKTSLVGNFLGDFIKGSALDDLPLDLQHGVRLHRQIDTYTDTHPVVLALKQQFPKSIRRYSGIVLDIYFDHLLMQHWQHFSAIDVKKHTLFNQFYHDLALLHHDISPHFSRVKTGLLRHQWLDDYEQLDACSRAMQTVEKRFTRPTEFAQQAMGFIHENSAGLQQSFLHFYPDLLGHSALFVSKLIK